MSAPDTLHTPADQRSTLGTRILHYCFAIFTLEVGLFLLIFPWTEKWMFNYFQDSYQWLGNLWLDPYFKGAISGLGVVNIYLSISDFFRTLRSA